MRAMKIGTSINLNDAAYNQIKVGDTLRNKHTGMLVIIDKYGYPSFHGDRVKPFNPDDWVLDTPWDAGLKAKHDTAETKPEATSLVDKFREELKSAQAAATEEVPENDESRNIIEAPDQSEEATGDEDDVLFIPAPQGEAQIHAKAQEAVGLLRSLGYSVIATKTVSCTISL